MFQDSFDEDCNIPEESPLDSPQTYLSKKCNSSILSRDKGNIKSQELDTFKNYLEDQFSCRQALNKDLELAQDKDHEGSTQIRSGEFSFMDLKEKFKPRSEVKDLHRSSSLSISGNNLERHLSGDNKRLQQSWEDSENVDSNRQDKKDMKNDDYSYLLLKPSNVAPVTMSDIEAGI
ncbi:unnamed protein product [Moneuplotes crassus]|uniref:Uncharacterized protein n=1 Tax=Euplotes crassus TaxID=5936 RepID=A0AAD1X7D0_EUPCR|nr:unnamed protein product [Moneuplotes crassus]